GISTSPTLATDRTSAIIAEGSMLTVLWRPSYQPQEKGANSLPCGSSDEIYVLRPLTQYRSHTALGATPRIPVGSRDCGNCGIATHSAPLAMSTLAPLLWTRKFELRSLMWIRTIDLAISGYKVQLHKNRTSLVV
uniref:Uncharacterized protein n=1 Tax=Chelydra serpentina TaxID=8475 RepID=A0A8C3RX74_CHESE